MAYGIARGYTETPRVSVGGKLEVRFECLSCEVEVHMFRVGDEFNSFDDLCDKISTFEQTQFVQLYIRRSRTITAASKRRTKKIYNEDLKYAEIEYACINGGKNFKTTSTGERPNQR